jgi:hypothetical protein
MKIDTKKLRKELIKLYSNSKAISYDEKMIKNIYSEKELTTLIDDIEWLANGTKDLNKAIIVEK